MRKAGAVSSAIQQLEDPAIRSTMLHWIPWRAQGCYIFACIDPEDVEGVNDEQIGEMDSYKLAEEAVAAHNSVLGRIDKP